MQQTTLQITRLWKTRPRPITQQLFECFKSSASGIMVASTTALALSTLVLCRSMAAASMPPSATVSLMVEGMLGDFEDEGYEG